MAFINEKMTAEEKAEFKAKNIPNPGYRRMTLEPSRWTINREENIYLVRGLEEHEEPFWYYFLLVWKGINIPVKLTQSWEKSTPLTWELISIDIPESFKEKKDNIIQSLKEALKVYEINGNPYGGLNQPIEVQCNF